MDDHAMIQVQQVASTAVVEVHWTPSNEEQYQANLQAQQLERQRQLEMEKYHRAAVAAAVLQHNPEILAVRSVIVTCPRHLACVLSRVVQIVWNDQLDENSYSDDYDYTDLHALMTGDNRADNSSSSENKDVPVINISFQNLQAMVQQLVASTKAARRGEGKKPTGICISRSGQPDLKLYWGKKKQATTVERVKDGIDFKASF